MALAGFSRLLGRSSDNFIPLLDNQTHGRKLLIDKGLAKKFAGIPVEGQNNVVQRLSSLSATAGGVSACSNIHDAASHMTILGSVGVTYKIFPNTGEPSSPPGVYITDVDLQSFVSGEPGLYKVNESSDEWVIDGIRPDRLKTGYAAINGLCRDIDQAATRLMPEFLASAYDSKASYHKENNLKSEGYTLFYNPPSLYTKGMRFKTPTQKRKGLAQTADMLKNQILNADRNVENMKWVIHGDGAKLFGKALKMLDGYDLSRHTMLFLAPREDVAQLLPAMNRSGIKLHGDVMSIQDDDWSSRSKQMLSGAKMSRELASYGGFSGSTGLEKGMVFRETARNDLFATVKSLTASATFGAGAITAGSAIAAGSFMVAAPAAIGVGTIAAGAGAVMSAYSMAAKAQSLRNSAANNVTNANLNPHLNPTKSKGAMNAAVAIHSGGQVSSFVKVLKAVVGRG